MSTTASLKRQCLVWRRSRALVLALLAAGASRADGFEERSPAPRIRAELSVSKDGDPIIIDALMAGKPYRLLLDTGSTACGFDTAHRAALGRPIGKATLITGGDDRTVEMFAPQLLTIAGLQFRPRGALGCAATPLVERDGARVDGVIGMDVLGRLVVSIDFDAGKLRIYTSADSSMGTPVPMLCKRGKAGELWFVRAALGRNRTEDFLIDTGSTVEFSGGISQDVFDALSSDGELLHVPPASHGRAESILFAGGGSMEMRAARLHRLAIAGFTHEGLYFFRERNRSALGLGYLSRYTITFDFPKRVMYLRPGGRAAEADRCNRSGLLVEPRGDVMNARWVASGSAADVAGLKRGDAVLFVDGQNTRDLSASRIRRILGVGGDHEIQIARDGQRMTITLTVASTALDKNGSTKDGLNERP